MFQSSRKKCASVLTRARDTRRIVMIPCWLIVLTLGLMSFSVPPIAWANNDDLEFWLNPSLAFTLNDERSIEMETAQRFRDASIGRSDTYFARIWLDQLLRSGLKVSGGIERRINEPGPNETRLLQQVSAGHGILRARMRLEQRFVDSADRLGWRLRPRLGVTLPFEDAGRWKFNADVELFLALRSNNRAGDQGLTGLRTQVGVSVDALTNLSLSVVYLRQHEFVDGGPDEVGHAPVFGMGFTF